MYAYTYLANRIGLLVVVVSYRVFVYLLNIHAIF